MDLSAVGDRLEALPAAEVLKRILDHNAEQLGSDGVAGMVETRLVTVGVSATGYPIKIDSKNNVVISTESGLGYLNVGELLLVEVLNPTTISNKLTTDPPAATKIVPPSSPPRQELRTELTKLNAKLEKRYRLTIEADVLDNAALGDFGKKQFARFLTVVEEAFDAIGSSDVGEITLSSLDRVAIVLGEQLAVKRSGSVMVLAAPFNGEFPSTLRAQLDTMLEANL